MSQQTAVAEQEAAAARRALPIEARRHAARVMYGESVTAGMPMTAHELGEAFGRSERWGRERMTEVRNDLAVSAETAVPADDPNPAEPEHIEILEAPNTPADQAPQTDEETPEQEHSQTDPGRDQDSGDTVTPRDTALTLATLVQHTRIRWGVRATLGLGVVASTVANVLHAHDNPISQTIAAWPPLALLATIELISRVPVHRRELSVLRFAATAVIAGIAAWVSYWHMADVIARYGETGASPYLIPLTVDGLVVVASVCLVELGSRIRALSAEVTK
ncbi:DUF2637 domain-containing protein [Couchioplanes caeruleus]|uniref:Uncharacterized protein DUF2637 n=1 Tax=Couchioplanes caeruleus TaxID=56438 RepID=A0A3N1GGY9_9ACTN|nr:DUF2637 domain-containing protein [Couchioplanes caeruleus]ROP29520.1 uncharacterized protein DUF2637 [Couchioplanes caeruleus]